MDHITTRLADSLRLMLEFYDGKHGEPGVIGCKSAEDARDALTAHDECSGDMGTPEEREPLLEFLMEDWTNSVAEGGFDCVETLLREGWAGYNNFTLAQLRKEAEDAGYGEDEE